MKSPFTQTLLVLILGIALVLLLFVQWKDNVDSKHQVILDQIVDLKNNQFENIRQNSLGLASSLSLKLSTDTSSIDDLLQSTLLQNSDIYQVRWLTLDGQEQNKWIQSAEGHVAKVEQAALQNKFEREYFQNALTSNNRISFSPIELNMEYGQIELPWHPVLRAMVSFSYKDNTPGILVFNLSVNNWLVGIDDPQQHYWLVDSKGSVFTGMEQEKLFGSQFKQGFLLLEQSPDLFNKIQLTNPFIKDESFWLASKALSYDIGNSPYSLYVVTYQTGRSISTFVIGSVLCLTFIALIIYRISKQQHQLSAKFVNVKKSHLEYARKERETLRQQATTLEKLEKTANIGTWEVDISNQSVHWSPITAKIHDVPPGYEPDLTSGISFYKEGECREKITKAVELAIAQGVPWNEELQIVTNSGKERWIRTLGQAEFVKGKCTRLFGTFEDITERLEAQHQIAQQKNLLTVTLKSIGDAVVTTNKSMEITYLNPVAEQLTGWSFHDAQGLSINKIFMLIDETTREPIINPIEHSLKELRTVGLSEGAMLISKHNKEIAIADSAAPIRDDTGEVVGAVMVFNDVTEQRRLGNEMTYQATHDMLTGLHNRNEFQRRLHITFDKVTSERVTSSLLYIDLDQFKIVNDTCGHTVGDELLIKIAKQLKLMVRNSDTVARLGGDEFAAILENCDLSRASKIAQKLCDKMEEFRFIHGDKSFRVGFSIGVVVIDNSWNNHKEIMKAGDTACYAAKDAGRNCFRVYQHDDATIKKRQGDMQWASRIETAIDNNKFKLFAQTIHPVSHSDEKLHLEILLRLQEENELINPIAFLPAAERFQLATRIDKWVLCKSIEYVSKVKALDKIGMVHVNLSGQSVGNRRFHEFVLHEFGSLSEPLRKLFCLEITETAAITNIADAGIFIEQVQSLGIKVALDDFGAGNATFSYLKNLAVDIIKIDGSFIRDLLTDELDDVAVRSFVEVAKVCGIKTVAEFVSDQHILKRLASLHVDYAQGYLLHKPEPIENVLKTLEATCLR